MTALEEIFSKWKLGFGESSYDFSDDKDEHMKFYSAQEESDHCYHEDNFKIKDSLNSDGDEALCDEDTRESVIVCEQEGEIE